METSAPVMNEKTKFFTDVNLFKLIRFNDIPFNNFIKIDKLILKFLQL